MHLHHHDSAERDLIERLIGVRLGLLLASYHRLTGRTLANGPDALWSAPFVVLAHDTCAPPLFIYANSMGLGLFKMSARQLIATPSHESAEPAAREERARMFARLEADDIVTDYGGVRIAQDGARFSIENAIIWNVRDADGALHGQAATFAQWSPADL